MPNHCTTTLHLKGDLKHRQEFVDKNKGFEWGDTMKKGTYKELSFHAQVPMPKKHIASHAKDKLNSDWYGWSNKNWGTKWDCYEEQLDHTDSYTNYCFDTAWATPVMWFANVSRKFPFLEFEIEWAEEGGCGGKMMFHGGECFYDVAMTDAEWKSFMGLDEWGDED